MELLYTLQINLLMHLNPVKLFQKINQLDWYKNTLEKWIEEQNLKENSKVLELGSATGAMTHYLSSSYETVGGDASKKMVKLAQKSYPNLNFQVEDAQKLSFENNQFDAVLSSSLVNVVDDPKTVLKEMLRVCKDGGIISFLVPLEGFSDKALMQLTEKLNLKNFSKVALKTWHKSATKISMVELERLVDIQGLSIVKVSTYLEGMVVVFTLLKESKE